ncbi:methionyl-tRNA formyltransferase [Candidatus Parcubacteria bacterium]|nr:methionyl-tRNA formyltransferase [Candidatus Parcubacteria bacterium]
MKNISFTFFGTSEFSVHVLNALKEKGLIPAQIITTPDKPSGRKLKITPSQVKVWALENKVDFLQPENLKNEVVVTELARELRSRASDVFIVASYGKIIPQSILDIPTHKTLNIHPSLLPKLRGSSPIQTAILTENETGVTIIRLDEKMDHGPIVAQKIIATEKWPPKYDELETLLGKESGLLLAEILPDWIAGKIIEKEQDHNTATFTKKIEKADGLISLEDNAEKNLRKIKAYNVWPSAYFFTHKRNKEIRVIITDAEIVDGVLKIKRVIPEGKKETSYLDFLKG